MKKNEKKREPLMYIQQPSLPNQEAKMQHTYRGNSFDQDEVGRKKKKIKEHHLEEKWDSDVEEQNVEAEELKVQSERSDEEGNKHEEDERPSWLGIRPVKSFQEMNIDEKLGHLSRQFIPYPCEFYVIDGSYRGMLHEMAEENITIKTFKNEVVTFVRKDLKNIKLIGSRG